MAEVKYYVCPYCRGLVSPRAEACPHCGEPLREQGLTKSLQATKVICGQCGRLQGFRVDPDSKGMEYKRCSACDQELEERREMNEGLD